MIEPITQHRALTPTSPTSMLSELMRWLPSNRAAARNRWADWADSFSNKYGRSVSRLTAPGFILAKSLGQVSSMRERWFVRSEKFFPTINLSVNAILRMTDPGVFGRSRRPGSAARVLQDRYIDPRSDRASHGEQAAAASMLTAALSNIDGTKPTAALSSIERIFRRIEGPATVLRLSEASLPSSELHQVQQRLVQQARRVESMMDAISPALASIESAPVVSKKRAGVEQKLANDAPQVAGDDGIPLRRSIKDSEVTGNQWRQERASEQVNIDQITEQVIRQLDRKVIAARERMGRTF
ncbi:MAG: hypothetical protein DMF61_03670 [Blastocatellia bacterium AA13]|nr:MAG: hypothetical protein DMF61_03670 [Blastocatellia bacterium AA13]